MTKLSNSEKLKLAHIFLNPTSENVALRKILSKLVMAARTSGGTAGRDEALCAACDEAESAFLLQHHSSEV